MKIPTPPPVYFYSLSDCLFLACPLGDPEELPQKVRLTWEDGESIELKALPRYEEMPDGPPRVVDVTYEKTEAVR